MKILAIIPIVLIILSIRFLYSSWGEYFNRMLILLMCAIFTVWLMWGLNYLLNN